MINQADHLKISLLLLISLNWDENCQLSKIVEWNTMLSPFRNIIKGNMHHKNDASLKDAFYIIPMASGFFVENFAS